MKVDQLPTSSNLLSQNSNQKMTTHMEIKPNQAMNVQEVIKQETDAIRLRGNVESTVNKLNEFIEPLHTNLKFQLHEELNEYYVTVVNPLTNEVIKEIPPKKMLDMYAAMAEYMGLLIDKKI